MDRSNDHISKITLAAMHHIDGWRGDFYPLAQDEEVVDTMNFWAPYLTRQPMRLEFLVEFLLTEGAYYAALDPLTQDRWTMLSDMPYKDWALRHPNSRMFVLDALDKRITSDTVQSRLELFINDLAG